jgi:hypothetical protein
MPSAEAGPIPAPEEPTVEIHKVKPIHSWRDFAKELGTIVLGIIIAITLEHVVEEWSWAREVKTARKAILAEIAANNANLLTIRVAIAPCVLKRIDEANAILTALEAGREPDKWMTHRPPAGSLLRDSEWLSERASQVLTHFPRDELALMSRYYAQIPEFREWASREGDGWRELSVMQKPLYGVTRSDLIRLRVNLENVRSFAGLIELNARRQLRVTEQLGVNERADPIRVKNFCEMNAADYTRYRRAQDLR